MSNTPAVVVVRGLWRLDDGREIERTTQVRIGHISASGPLGADALAAIMDIAVHALRLEGRDFPEGHATLVDVLETDIPLPSGGE